MPSKQNITIRVYPKSNKYTARVRDFGYPRSQRVLKSKKVIFDEPIVIRPKRDAFGQFKGSAKVRRKR